MLFSIDKSVHIYEINGGSCITAKKKMMLSGPATDVSYSPDGKYLVSADGNRKGTQIWMELVNTTLEIKLILILLYSSVPFHSVIIF